MFVINIYGSNRVICNFFINVTYLHHMINFYLINILKISLLLFFNAHIKFCDNRMLFTIQFILCIILKLIHI